MVPRKEGVLDVTLTKIPASIWYLGFVTLLKNMSSVIVGAFSPLFLLEVLGVTVQQLGWLEGGVEAISFFARVFAGVLSDSFKKRKFFILIGYIFGFVGRVFLALSTTVWEVFLSRSCERLGNGIQASPRDALVADLSTPENRGACYGLRQSLTVAGSVLGATLGMLFMLFSASHNYRLIFFLTLIPSSLAIFLLLVGVQEPASLKAVSKEKNRFQWNDIRKDLSLLPLPYWKLITLSFLFMIGNFSITFIVLRAKEGGVSVPFLPVVLIIQNVGTALSAFPSGWLADKIDRRHVLLFGFCLLAVSNGLLALSSHYLLVFLATFLWGAQLGITQSNFMAFVAENTPSEVRGTGFGVFHFMNGLAILLGNGVMGWFWESVSVEWAFGSSTLIVLFSILLLSALIPLTKEGFAKPSLKRNPQEKST